MPDSPAPRMGDVVHDEERPWCWRNCREITIGADIHLLPWQWHIRSEVRSSCCELFAALQLGPLSLTLYCDIGNISDETWRARFGLSETEAWERSGNV